jgi:hypothetical protein
MRPVCANTTQRLPGTCRCIRCTAAQGTTRSFARRHQQQRALDLGQPLQQRRPLQRLLHLRHQGLANEGLLHVAHRLHHLGIVQLCRYITCPALSDERVQLNAAGQVELKLFGPWWCRKGQNSRHRRVNLRTAADPTPTAPAEVWAG